MKKKAVSMLVCILLLAGLTAAYFIIKNNNEQETPNDVEPSETIYLLNRDRTEINSMTLKNQDMDVTFIPANDSRDEWIIEGMEDLHILNTNINTLSYCFGDFTAYQRLEAENVNPADFGFAEPLAVATATYTDGSKETFMLGGSTPDKEYAYIMREGDDTIYLIYEYTSNRFKRTMDELINKTLPSMVADDIAYFYVNQKDYQTVELNFDGTTEELIEMYETYGGLSLQMMQPYEGREVYASNLDLYVVTNLSTMALGKLVELSPDDYGRFGLDEPELEINITNAYNEGIHLYVGDIAEDGYRYCRLDGRSEVFTIATEMVQPYYNIDVFKFINRFAALINIMTVDKLSIVSEDVSYELFTNHGVIKATEEGQQDVDTITPLVNGKLVDDSLFRKTYESIISISFDSVIEPTAVSRSPDITVTYELNTGEPDVVLKLYEYNNDFYMIEDMDGICNFVSNKLTVRNMFTKLEELIK